MKRFRNESGVTLVEILAVLTIASFIMTLIMGIHIFVQKQYNSQSTDAKQLTDVTIAIKSITRDIRMAELNEIDVSNNITLNFTDRNINYVWDKEREILQKNNSDYIFNVVKFHVSPNGRLEKDESIELEIKSTTGQRIETEIIIR